MSICLTICNLPIFEKKWQPFPACLLERLLYDGINDEKPEELKFLKDGICYDIFDVDNESDSEIFM